MIDRPGGRRILLHVNLALATLVALATTSIVLVRVEAHRHEGRHARLEGLHGTGLIAASRLRAELGLLREGHLRRGGAAPQTLEERTDLRASVELLSENLQALREVHQRFPDPSFTATLARTERAVETAREIRRADADGEASLRMLEVADSTVRQLERLHLARQEELLVSARAADVQWARIIGASLSSFLAVAIVAVGSSLVIIRRSLNERDSTLQELGESHERFRSLAANIGDVSWLIDVPTKAMLYVSPAYETIWGQQPGSILGRPLAWLENIVPLDREATQRSFELMFEGQEIEVEYRVRRPDGQQRTIMDRGWPVHDEEGHLVRLAGLARDVTALRRTESELRQAQKMEAVGQLTSGVAHDFNNILTVILINLQLLAEELEGDTTKRSLIQEANDAVVQASRLVNQLLAFARKQPLAPAPTNLAALLSRLEPIWRSALGETMELELNIPENAWNPLVDAAQLEAALLNLCLNARDAMPDGGRLVVSVTNVAGRPGQEGRHSDRDRIVVAVADNGRGMPRDVADYAFEPFFTTKAAGEGSGLGLSMVHGFALQSGGDLRLQSELGVGTRLELELPRAPKADACEPSATPLPYEASSRDKVILVVEDQPTVRRAALSLLTRLRYHTLEAANGPAAMEILRSDAVIDVMFSDVVMPGGMSGWRLAQEAQGLRPQLRVLLATGYSDRGEATLRPRGLRIIGKPYTIQEVADALASLQSDRS